MAKRPDFVTVMDTSTFVTGDGTTFFGPPPQSKDTPTDTTTARWITNIREKLTTDKTIGALVLEPFARQNSKVSAAKLSPPLVQPLFLSKHRQRFCGRGRASIVLCFSRFCRVKHRQYTGRFCIWFKVKTVTRPCQDARKSPSPPSPFPIPFITNNDCPQPCVQRSIPRLLAHIRLTQVSDRHTLTGGTALS
jgi:hypothetical protein